MYSESFSLGYLVYREGSNESKLLKDKITQLAISNLSTKNNFLDIGAADGHYTVMFGELFEHSFAIEPDPILYDILKNRIQELDSYKCYFKNAEEILDNLPVKYDLMLASHILYYIKFNLWPSFISRLQNSLEEEGKLVIVLWSKSSELFKLSHEINPAFHSPTSEDLETVLLQNNIEFTKYSICPEIAINNKESLIQILCFLSFYENGEIISISPTDEILDKNIVKKLNNKQDIYILLK